MRLKSHSCVLHFLVCLLFLASIFTATGCKSGEDKTSASDKQKPSTKTLKVQEAMVAGKFYSNDPKSLSDFIDNIFEQADQIPLSDNLTGLIVPHGGYVYSGPIAAYAYKNLIGQNYDRVVIIAFSHYTHFQGVLVHDADVYRTPLGDAPIDREYVKKLIEKGDIFTSGEGLAIKEHSGDVQVPFIQKALPGTPIISMIMGDSRPEMSNKTAKALYGIFKGTRTLFIASTDLSLDQPYSDTYTLDSLTISMISNGDPGEFIKTYYKHKGKLACGFGPILTLMELFKLQGGGDIKVLKHATSGDTAGAMNSDKGVVGYVSMAFIAKNLLQAPTK